MIPNPCKHAEALVADHGSAAESYAQIGVDCATADDMRYRLDLLEEVRRLVRRAEAIEVRP